MQNKLWLSLDEIGAKHTCAKVRLMPLHLRDQLTDRARGCPRREFRGRIRVDPEARNHIFSFRGRLESSETIFDVRASRFAIGSDPNIDGPFGLCLGAGLLLAQPCQLGLDERWQPIEAGCIPCSTLLPVLRSVVCNTGSLSRRIPNSAAHRAGIHCAS
jgi:hypothetical protein